MEYISSRERAISCSIQKHSPGPGHEAPHIHAGFRRSSTRATFHVRIPRRDQLPAAAIVLRQPLAIFRQGRLFVGEIEIRQFQSRRHRGFAVDRPGGFKSSAGIGQIDRFDFDAEEISRRDDVPYFTFLAPRRTAIDLAKSARRCSSQPAACVSASSISTPGNTGNVGKWSARYSSARLHI